MESPGGSRGSLKGCSSGKGPRGSREGCEEGGAAERGWDGLTAAPEPTPAPLGVGRGVWREGVKLGVGKGGVVRRYQFDVCLFFSLPKSGKELK